MKKYKLGDVIRKVEGNKNKQLKDLPLLGINIEKEFMPSVANTIGTDMSNYQIVKKEQFACNPMHLGRDERMPTALLLDRDEILVSPAYFVFEIIDKNIILPEYLMLYFKRPETDRLLWFKTDSSVRGGLGWNEFCAVELSIPSIEKQKKIVEQHNQITEAIRIKERLNNNLEQQAFSLLKKHIPYSLEDALPDEWKKGTLEDIIEIHDNKRIPLSSGEREEMKNKIYPYYGAASLMDYVDNYIFDGIYVLFGEDGTVMDEMGHPILQYVWGKFWVNNHAHILTGKLFSTENLYLICKQLSVSNVVTGAVQAKISQANLKSLEIIIPPSNIIKALNTETKPLFDKIRKNKDIINLLLKFKNTFLPKLMLEES